MSRRAPVRSAQDLQNETVELARNGIILHPDLPAIQLAEIMLNELAEADFLAELSKALTIRRFTLAINAERRKDKKPAETPPLFAGLDSLPRLIAVNGKRHSFETATITHLRAYLKTANKRHKERIAQVKSVLDLMKKYAGEKHGITVAQVAALEVATRPAQARTRSEVTR